MVLLGATGLWVDVHAVVAELMAARVVPLVVALGLSMLLTVALAGRWSFTAGRMGLEVPLRVAVAEYFASTFLNRVLPGGVFGDVGRAVRVGRRHPGAKGAAARSVVLERLSGQIALWGVVVVGLIAWAGESRALTLGIAGAIVLAGAAAALLPRVPAIANTRVGRGWSLVLGEARQSFLDRGAWAVQLSLSLLSIVVLTGMYAACIRAVGTPATLAQLMVIAPVLLAVTSLPLSVGGWGIREAASVVMFQMTDLDPTAGVATSAAFGAVNLVAALPGIVVLLRSPAQRADEDEQVAPE